MALRRRTTPVRPIEKVSIAAYLIAIVALGVVLMTGGFRGSGWHKQVWLVGFVALGVGSICTLVSGWGRRHER
jgi:Na+-driven multidrug efflux pump